MNLAAGSGFGSSRLYGITGLAAAYPLLFVLIFFATMPVFALPPQQASVRVLCFVQARLR